MKHSQSLKQFQPSPLSAEGLGFSVVVMNSISILEAQRVSVSFPEGDAVFVVKLQDFTATEKDELVLNCELSKDVPVVWYHSEKEITASKTVVLKSEGTCRSLLLKRVEQSNKGTYTCDCGTDKTSAVIDVQGLKPKP